MRKRVVTNPVNTEQEKNYKRRTGCNKLERNNMEKENIQIMKIANSSALRKSKISLSNRKQWLPKKHAQTALGNNKKLVTKRVNVHGRMSHQGMKHQLVMKEILAFQHQFCWQVARKQSIPW